jgi:uncharacterized protein YyaL (SSP411 family)
MQQSRLSPVSWKCWLLALLITAVSAPAAGADDPPPIRWLEWSRTTLVQADRLGKPVLVFLTASWCVECQRVEEEILGDPEVRRRVDEGFLAVRIDRDRRPDLFRRYVRGGLPSVAFVLASGNSMFFRDGDDLLRAGGANLSVETFLPYLDLVEKHYRRSRDAMETMVKRWLKRAKESRNTASLALEPSMAGLAANTLLRLQDPVHGGVRSTVKEVRSEPVRAALEHYAYTRDEDYREFATRTLEAMSRGAVRDPLDGSFHRLAYSQDWGSPGPERVLHTQSDMLLAFLEAYRSLGDERYREVAWQLTDVLLGPFLDPELQLFRASLVPEDPASLLWSWRRFRQALRGPQVEAAALRYGMDATADELPRHLRDAMDSEEVAASLKRPADEIRALLEEAAERLRSARSKRSSVKADRMILAGWNAEAANALLHSWAVLGREDARRAALTTLRYIMERLVSNREGVFHGMEVQPSRILSGILLWDQIQVARGCLMAFQVPGTQDYLECGRRRLKFTVGTFVDKEWGGVVDRRPAWGDMGEEGIPDRRIEDNADAAIALYEMAALEPGSPLWKDGRKILEAFADEFSSYGVRAIPMSVALHRSFRHPAQVAVVQGTGEEDATAAGELRRAALAALPVWKVVLPLRDVEDEPVLRQFGILPRRGTAAYLVQGSTNRGPFRSVEELQAALAPREGE